MNFGLDLIQYQILNKNLISPMKLHEAKLWVFGSRARGDQNKFSDIDIMFELPKDKTLPKGFLYEIKENMEASDFKYKVDLVENKAIAQSYKENAFKERVQIK